MMFALGVSIVTAVIMGLLTAWHGTKGDIRESLSASQRTQTGTGSSATIRRSLVVSQMALTVVLLVGAGLLGRSFLRLLEINPGYRTQHAVVLDATLPYERGAEAASRRVAFYRELMSRLRAIPGVTNVGAASGFPLLSGGGRDGSFIVMSRIDEPLRMEDYPILTKDPKRSGSANFVVVDGNYFDVMNIPVVTGRVFNSGDTPDAAHAGVISASFAKSKWPNENPIGKIIQYGNMDGDLRPYTVVGVVGDVRDQNLANEPTPTFYAYQPQRQNAANEFHVVMQTAGDPTSVMASARAIVRQLKPDVPPVLRTMETIVSTSVADRRFVLVLVGVFGGAALVLATLGVYSVISYLVTQRRQEIGVRIALGAQRGDVLSLVLRQGALLAVIGIVVGAVGALFLTRLLKGLVFGVSTTDPDRVRRCDRVAGGGGAARELAAGSPRDARRSYECAARVLIRRRSAPRPIAARRGRDRAPFVWDRGLAERVLSRRPNSLSRTPRRVAGVFRADRVSRAARPSRRRSARDARESPAIGTSRSTSSNDSSPTMNAEPAWRRSTELPSPARTSARG